MTAHAIELASSIDWQNYALIHGHSHGRTNDRVRQMVLALLFGPTIGDVDKAAKAMEGLLFCQQHMSAAVLPVTQVICAGLGDCSALVSPGYVLEVLFLLTNTDTGEVSSEGQGGATNISNLRRQCDAVIIDHLDSLAGAAVVDATGRDAAIAILELLAQRHPENESVATTLRTMNG